MQMAANALVERERACPKPRHAREHEVKLRRAKNAILASDVQRRGYDVDEIELGIVDQALGILNYFAPLRDVGPSRCERQNKRDRE